MSDDKRSGTVRRIPVGEVSRILDTVEAEYIADREKKWLKILESLQKSDQRKAERRRQRWLFKLGLLKDRKVRTIDELDAWARSNESAQDIFDLTPRIRLEWKYDRIEGVVHRIRSLIRIAKEEPFLTISSEDAQRLYAWLPDDPEAQ